MYQKKEGAPLSGEPADVHIRQLMHDSLAHHENSEAPPVCHVGMSFSVDNLRGHVLDSTAEGICLVLQVLLGQPKVCDCDVTFDVQQEAEIGRRGVFSSGSNVAF